MQLFMKTSVVSVINLEKSMYLVLQALLVVCVYLIFECSDCQARLEVIIYNHYGLIKKNNNLTLFVLYASVVLVHQSCSSFIVLNKKTNVLL